MPTFIDVLFEVPKEISSALLSGKMARRGGVVQWASGSQRGEVVTWLREVGGLSRLDPSNLPAQVTQQLAQLQTSSSVLMLGQALNLGVSVMSFAILNHKLNVIDKKLQTVLAALRGQEEEMSWLNGRSDVEIAARLLSALETAALPSSQGSTQVLSSLHRDILGAQRNYEGLLIRMLDSGRAYKYPDLFSSYLAGMSVASVAKGQLLIRLEGTQFALSKVTEDEVACQRLVDAFRSPLVPGSDGWPQVALPPDLRSGVRDSLLAMREGQDRLYSYRTELSYRLEASISDENWEKLGERDEPGLALLVPQPRLGGSP